MEAPIESGLIRPDFILRGAFQGTGLDGVILEVSPKP